MKKEPVKPRVISLVNLRGGAGRTTLAIAMAACLAEVHRKRVLLLDFDPSGNASTQLKRFDITQGASLTRRIVVSPCISFDLSTLAPLYIGRYDFVLIDNPATLCPSLWNGLALSTHYLIPAIPEAAFVPEIVRLFRMVGYFSKRRDHEIKALGIVVTHVREGEMLEGFRRKLLFEEGVNPQKMPPLFKHFIHHIPNFSENGLNSIDILKVIEEALQPLS